MILNIDKDTTYLCNIYHYMYICIHIFGLSHAYLCICQAFWHAFFELNLTLVHSEAIYHSETDGSREKRRADLNRSRGAWCEMWLYDIIFEDGSKLLISNVLICFDAWHMKHIDHLLGHHQICGSFGTLVWDQVLLNRYPFYPFV